MSVGLVTIAMWIGLTGFGAIVGLVNLQAARDDFEVQRGRQWWRVLTAKVNIAFEILRVVAHVLLFVAGVLVAWVQFNPDPPPASLYVRCVILFVIASLVAETLVHRWLRHRLTRTTTP